MAQGTFKNMGAVDRTLRFLIGVVAVSLVFVGPKTPWGYLGLLPLVTSTVGFCPLYAVLGWSTKRQAAA